MNNYPNVLKETANGISQVCITDELLEQRKVFLNQQVDTDTMTSLIQQFMYLEQKEDGKPIYFFINSPGGSVIDGMALYDFIKLLHSPVITVCMGNASSMGALLFLAGERRVMLKHSKIMIHDASFGHAEFSGLKPDEIKERTEQLVKTCELLRRIVAERTGRSLEEVTEKMKTDSYFESDEAVEFGLATEVANSFKMNSD